MSDFTPVEIPKNGTEQLQTAKGEEGGVSAPEAQPRNLDERREAVLQAIEGMDVAGIVDVLSLPLNIALAKFRRVAVLTLYDKAVVTKDKGVFHEV